MCICMYKISYFIIYFMSAGFASSSNQLHTTSHSSNFDPTLCLDMLSLAMEGPEMSVRQSVHIGLAPRDIQLTKFQLPSDEEMAKGNVYEIA